jgi:hypothetical protein
METQVSGTGLGKGKYIDCTCHYDYDVTIDREDSCILKMG